MSSVLRPVRERKKSRTLGPVDVIRREDYGDLELDAKVELIRSLVPLGLMHVEEMLDDEVTALAGPGMPARTPRSGAVVTAAIRGRWASRGSACPFVSPGFVVSRGARFRCGPTPRCMARARSTTGC